MMMMMMMMMIIIIIIIIMEDVFLISETSNTPAGHFYAIADHSKRLHSL